MQNEPDAVLIRWLFKGYTGDGGACEKCNIGLPISRRFAEVLDRGKLIRRPAWGERRVI